MHGTLLPSLGWRRIPRAVGTAERGSRHWQRTPPGIARLLPAGDASAWHVVDADELWLWHGPGAVTLELGGNGEQPNERDAQRATLCVDKHGACGELVVPAGVWQRTIPSDEDALVSCVVSPGFTFAGFKLASRD